MISESDNNKWYEGTDIKGVKFKLGCSAKVLFGKHHGDIVTVICLESTAPSITFLVENAEGQSYTIDQNKLQPAD